MSIVARCDGCGKTTKTELVPKEWLAVDVRNGSGVIVADGDFCTPDCLARFLGSDKLDAQIKRGAA